MGRFNIVLSIIFVFSLLILVWVFSNIVNVIDQTDYDGLPVCGDGSLYDTCSLRKPNFCLNGTLVEKATICGCSSNLTRLGDNCFSEYQSNPKEVILKYVLRGEEKNLSFIVYGELVTYLSDLSPLIKYYGNDTPSRVDFKLKNLDDEQQMLLLLPLVTEIQNIAKNEEDQVRIAISISQNIQWGWSDKTTNFRGFDLQYSRHPYEVLDDTQGVCGEKSELLAFILRELGYGVVFFYNQEENHESIGIKCPIEESWYDTGYCFIETTGPSIMTDTSIEYVGGLTLESEPQVLLISEGKSIGNDWYEYEDAKDLIEIKEALRDGKTIINPKTVFRFNELETKYGLVKEYNAA